MTFNEMASQEERDEAIEAAKIVKNFCAKLKRGSRGQSEGCSYCPFHYRVQDSATSWHGGCKFQGGGLEPIQWNI